MSNIYFCLTNLSPGQFLASSKSCRYHRISKLLVATILHRLMNFKIQRVHVFLLRKKVKFNKNETNSKIESTAHAIGKRTLCFTS